MYTCVYSWACSGRVYPGARLFYGIIPPTNTVFCGVEALQHWEQMTPDANRARKAPQRSNNKIPTASARLPVYAFVHVCVCICVCVCIVLSCLCPFLWQCLFLYICCVCVYLLFLLNVLFFALSQFELP